jgi:hypothetical protein
MIGGNAAGYTGIRSGNTIYVDAVNGNNLTATRGRLDLPFKDPVAATLATGITSGDIIQVGTGTYDIHALTGYGGVTGQLRLPNGVSINGSGPYTTIIANQATFQSYSVLNPGNNSTVSNLQVLGSTTQGVYISLLGFLLTGDQSSTNVVIQNVITQGWSDGVNINAGPYLSSPVTWRFIDCQFISNFDCANIIDQAQQSIFEFYNCQFRAIGVNSTTYNTLRGLVTAGGTARVFGGSIICTAQSGSNCSGVNIDGTGATSNVYLYNTAIFLIGTGGGGNYSIYGQTGANFYVGPGVSYDTGLVFLNGATLSSVGSSMIPVTSSPIGSPPAGVLGSLAYYSGNLYLCTNESAPTWIGVSGYSGYSGISGYSGYSGKSGYSGYSG